ncbi:c-type cytochrome (plasmid) [Bradyrhizobium sp. PMVTL-01]|uniref:c-type cytochrome n=1 Tax=Bradyrhizobium sp. PMVTL-01 TaxID=3434999 RepID=UPI003F6FF442
MKCRTLLSAAIVTMLPLFNAGAENLPAGNTSTQLSDLMVALQFQHIKLWFAGRLSNWSLANYELRQIEANLRKAMPHPSESLRLSQANEQLQALDRAIELKDSAAFAKAYSDLTNGCNTCHRASGFGSITIQVPVNSPFGDQLFADQIAQGRALARGTCGLCHVISDSLRETPAFRLPAPSFSEIASRPSFSANDLRQLLTSNHRRVGPNQAMLKPKLVEYQIDAIVAFFETLQADRAR